MKKHGMVALLVVGALSNGAYAKDSQKNHKFDVYDPKVEKAAKKDARQVEKTAREADRKAKPDVIIIEQKVKRPTPTDVVVIDTRRNDNLGFQVRQKIQGVVTSGGVGGFYFRANDGRSFRVNYSTLFQRYEAGDVVEVNGYFNNSASVFKADNVRLIRDASDRPAVNRTVRGVITSLGVNKFEIVTDQLTTQVVNTHGFVPYLEKGYYVESVGKFNSYNNRFDALSVKVLDRNGNKGGATRTYRGVVTDNQRGADGFMARINGVNTLVVVRGIDRLALPNLERGDDIQIEAFPTNNGLQARRVLIVGRENYDGEGRDIVLVGKVIDVQGTMFTVRDQGGDYPVQGGLGSNVLYGTYVRVKGNLQRGVVQARDIQRLDSDRIRMKGRVQNIGIDMLTISDDDDGRVYRVFYGNERRFRVGEKVTVFGRFSGLDIVADDIDRR